MCNNDKTWIWHGYKYKTQNWYVDNEPCVVRSCKRGSETGLELHRCYIAKLIKYDIAHCVFSAFVTGKQFNSLYSITVYPPLRNKKKIIAKYFHVRGRHLVNTLFGNSRYSPRIPITKTLIPVTACLSIIEENLFSDCIYSSFSFLTCGWGKPSFLSHTADQL